MERAEIKVRDIYVRHAKKVFSGAFSSDGKFLALLRHGKPPIVRNLQSRCDLTLPIAEPATCVAFHPNIPEAAFGFAGGHCVKRIDMRLPNLCFQLGQMTDVTSLTYSNGGRILFAGTSDGFVIAYNLDSNPRPQGIFHRHIARAAIVDLDYSPSTESIIAAPSGRLPLKVALTHREIANCLALSNKSAFSWECYAVSCHPKMQRTIAGGVGSTVYVMDHNSGEVSYIPTGLKYVRKLQIVPQQNLILIVGSDAVEQWTLQGLFLHRWQAAQGKVICARQVGDELLVAWG